jgi:hypothetical protein
MDRVSDRSKGFGFVTFASADEAQKALMEFNGQVYCVCCCLAAFTCLKLFLYDNKRQFLSAIKRPDDICGLRKGEAVSWWWWWLSNS